MGTFVTFDGPNGAGKSAVLGAVSERLASLGIQVHVTREPTASSLGVFVRSAEASHRGRSLACLVAADRYYHLESEVRPALIEGKIVLSDRYVESSLVLQQLDGVQPAFIWAVNSEIVRPDLSVIVTASPETLDRRLAERKEHSWFEQHHSRAEESRLYIQSVRDLAEKGFNVCVLENDTTPLAENAELVTKLILKIHRKGR